MVVTITSRVRNTNTVPIPNNIRFIPSDINVPEFTQKLPKVIWIKRYFSGISGRNSSVRTLPQLVSFCYAYRGPGPPQQDYFNFFSTIRRKASLWRAPETDNR